MGFVTEYNEKTASQAGSIVPGENTVYEDRSFDFIIKSPPASDLLRKAAGVDKGSGNPLVEKWQRYLAIKLRRLQKQR